MVEKFTYSRPVEPKGGRVGVGGVLNNDNGFSVFLGSLVGARGIAPTGSERSPCKLYGVCSGQ